MPVPTDLPVFSDTTSWEDAQRELDAAGLTDGLPVVPPTSRRLDAMLAAAHAPDRSYGPLPPLFGALTPRAVAYHAVLAGCRPEELGVVVSALAATLDPGFNLLGIQTTTGSAAVAVVVHGPVRAALGMNAGANCLGPGNRANACIGRAVQLTLVNLGGAAPGSIDMATTGQPGKYTFCFAEGDDPSYPAFHVRRGFAAEHSAVTVVGAAGTMELVPPADGATAQDILAPLLGVAGEGFVLIPPELAVGLRRNGWTLERIQEYIRKPGDAHVHVLVTGGTGIKMTYLPTWPGGTSPVTAEVIAP